MAAKSEKSNVQQLQASASSSSSSFSAKVHPSELDPNNNNHNNNNNSSYSLEKFILYETRQRFYLIGSDRNKRVFRVLKIDRSEPSDLNISEDPVLYSPKEIKNLLQRIDEGNRATGGLIFVAKVYGIAGNSILFTNCFFFFFFNFTMCAMRRLFLIFDRLYQISGVLLSDSRH